MSFRTVAIESPCRLSYQGGYMVVRKEDDTSKVHLSEISTVILATEQVYISAYLLAELAKAKISLIVSDEKNNPVGEYLPLYGAHNTSKRILEQIAWGEPIKKRVWQRIVKDKITAQAEVLAQYEYDQAVRQLKTVAGEVRSGDTTNREAHAARLYFSTLFGPQFNRDQDSPLNASLNYGYAVLLSAVNREIVSRGFLTSQGINHKNEYNQFNLACDFMEPFRPVIDITVMDNFTMEFDRDMRLVLTDILNKTLVYRDGSYKLHSMISLYVQDCLNALNKKISVDDIESYTFS